MVSGKALGGTSKVNACIYTRAVPGEYNSWQANGRKGWAWEDVLPYFKKSETSLTHGATDYRGSDGEGHTFADCISTIFTLFLLFDRPMA
jgi:choline dehydrogenase